MVRYEWDCQEISENGDVLDHYHADTLREALAWQTELAASGRQTCIELVRDAGTEAHGITDRQWACLENGTLPAQFSGGAIVPKRFHAECARTR